MLTNKARVVGLLGLALLLGGGAFAVRPGESPRAIAAESNNSKVKALLKERLDILKAISSQVIEQYHAGQASFSHVYDSIQAVNRAELDMCDTDTERVAVLERMLAEAVGSERHAEAAFKSGQASSSAALTAKVNRLEIEISLERARDK